MDQLCTKRTGKKEVFKSDSRESDEDAAAEGSGRGEAADHPGLPSRCFLSAFSASPAKRSGWSAGEIAWDVIKR
jgi:hypothetical protein